MAHPLAQSLLSHRRCSRSRQSQVGRLLNKVQDFHFLLQDPLALELIFKPREAQRIIDFDTFLKGFRRVLEGVLKGPSADPFCNPSQTLQKPFGGPGVL